MKKNFKEMLFLSLLVIASILNLVISLCCFFTLLGNAHILKLHRITMSSAEAACYFIISGYSLLITVNTMMKLNKPKKEKSFRAMLVEYLAVCIISIIISMIILIILAITSVPN